MSILRITIRLILIGVHILVGILLCLSVLPSDWVKKGTPWQRNVVRWWLRRTTHIIGIRLTIHGKPITETALVIANHISWMDIVIVGGLQPVSFLSKAEIAHWLVVGYLARKAGTLFIARGAGVEATAQLFSQRLHAGANIAFFPEGTTSDGSAIRPFYPRLFMAAIDNHVPIQPLVISYPCKGAPNNTHPKAPYASDGLFFRQALSILAEPRIDVTVHYTDSLVGNGSRKQLAAKAHELMAAVYDKRHEKQ